MRRLTVLGLALTAAWVVAITSVLALKSGDISTMTLNAWGDFLAGVSAPLALLWLVVGYFQHGEELRLQERRSEIELCLCPVQRMLCASEYLERIAPSRKSLRDGAKTFAIAVP